MTDTSKQSWNIPLWAGEAQNVDRIVRESDRILCATSHIQWSYAIVFKVPTALRSCSSELVIEVHLDVISGRVGFAALRSDEENFINGIEEAFSEPGTGIVSSLIIPQTEVPNLAMLVIRNAAPNNAISEFIIQSISARSA